MMKRLLDAHVKSSHASTKVHGRYCSVEARCALIESKTISLDVVVVVVVVVPPTPKERNLNAKPSPSTRSTPRHYILLNDDVITIRIIINTNNNIKITNR
jgi:hypothetical protein